VDVAAQNSLITILKYGHLYQVAVVFDKIKWAKEIGFQECGIYYLICSKWMS